MGSDLLSDVPAILADLFEQGAIQWRPDEATAWASLDGARLAGRREVTEYDTRREREHLMQEATLSVPSSSAVLQFDYQIMEADGTGWAVLSRRADADVGAVTYTVRRDPTLRYVADKGRLS